MTSIRHAELKTRLPRPGTVGQKPTPEPGRRNASCVMTQIAGTPFPKKGKRASSQTARHRLGTAGAGRQCQSRAGHQMRSAPGPTREKLQQWYFDFHASPNEKGSAELSGTAPVTPARGHMLCKAKHKSCYVDFRIMCSPLSQTACLRWFSWSSCAHNHRPFKNCTMSSSRERCDLRARGGSRHARARFFNSRSASRY